MTACVESVLHARFGSQKQLLARSCLLMLVICVYDLSHYMQGFDVWVGESQQAMIVSLSILEPLQQVDFRRF
jgi:hypothetical protein